MPVWNDRSEVAQASLEYFYQASPPQLLHNTHPAGDDTTFNYWWLAHVIDVRLDAWHRTGEDRYLAMASATAENIIERNSGSPFNDYFDDMLWFGLASVRLHRASGEQHHPDRAIALWEHVNQFGWNDTLGESLSWRKPSPGYKNTPANGPFVILGERLQSLGAQIAHRDRCATALDWLQERLVTREGFVHDGINREGDGRVDTDWKFTYNQGVYVGALVATAEREHDQGRRSALLERALATAQTALRELVQGGVFVEHGEGADVGLFKGICLRYFGLLHDALPEGHPFREEFAQFVQGATDVLWTHGLHDGHLLPADDWRHPGGDGPTPYSTLLSAIMAVELRARLEEGRPADSRVVGT